MIRVARLVRVVLLLLGLPSSDGASTSSPRPANPDIQSQPSTAIPTDVPLPSSKPTTTTPTDRPSLHVYFKQFSSVPKSTRFTTQQLHQYLGCRSLKDWKTLGEFAQPTVSVSDLGENLVKLGDVVNLKSARKNSVPVPRPHNLLDVVHVDFMLW